MSNQSATRPRDGERQFLGHPWGLANLAGVEMWERFSFYGLQALLAFYLYYSVSDGGCLEDRNGSGVVSLW